MCDYSPDYITGYNIFGFDYAFMYQRAKETNCVIDFLKMSRNRDELCGKTDRETGEIMIEETSIVIAVACKHRDEAYILSRYIIEEIKKRSPIWKKEHYQNNDSTWLKGNPIINEKN